MTTSLDIQDVAHLDRAKGAFLGLAIGDALGTTLEFSSRRPGHMPAHSPGEKINWPAGWHTKITGGGPFNMPVGGWTDDTSMALCIAQSIIENEGINHYDTMERYLRWRSNGYMSHNGRCFDIGGTCSGAISRFAHGYDPFSGSTNPRTAGNGCIMRLAPVPMLFWDDPELAAYESGESSKTTHGTQECVDSCRYMGWLLATFISGHKDRLNLDCPFADDLSPKVQNIANMGHRISQIGRGVIKSTGYVIDSLEAALWAFHRTGNFEDGAILAVNLGGDADTIGAIYGQIAGAYYGYKSIPKKWRDKVLWRERMENMAEIIFSLADDISPRPA